MTVLFGVLNAYVRAVAHEYRSFRNPVTGREMDYSATVHLRLRAKMRADLGRAEWGDEPDRDEDRRDAARRKDDGRHDAPTGTASARRSR